MYAGFLLLCPTSNQESNKGASLVLGQVEDKQEQNGLWLSLSVVSSFYAWLYYILEHFLVESCLSADLLMRLGALLPSFW